MELISIFLMNQKSNRDIWWKGVEKTYTREEPISRSKGVSGGLGHYPGAAGDGGCGQDGLSRRQPIGLLNGL